MYPIASGDGNGTLLQNLPKQAAAGYYKVSIGACIHSRARPRRLREVNSDGHPRAEPTIPLHHLKWFVDFNAGANLTFVLVDGAGASAYSEFRVVQANEQGANYSCP